MPVYGVWLVKTRPDVSFDVLHFSMCINQSPEVRHLIEANKMVKKIKSDQFKLIYPKMNVNQELRLVVFTDASHANLPDGASSAGAHIILLVGENNDCCILNWSSNKIKRVAKSTTAAESLALSDGLDDALYLSELLAELLRKDVKKITINAKIDNKNLHSLIYSTKVISEKRLRIDIAAIKEMLIRKEISTVEWIPTERQLTDCLTKHGTSCQSLQDILSIGKLDV